MSFQDAPSTYFQSYGASPKSPYQPSVLAYPQSVASSGNLNSVRSAAELYPSPTSSNPPLFQFGPSAHNNYSSSSSCINDIADSTSITIPNEYSKKEGKK